MTDSNFIEAYSVAPTSEPTIALNPLRSPFLRRFANFDKLSISLLIRLGLLKDYL